MTHDPPSEPPPIEIEIADVLDLHSFPPAQIGEIVEDYLDLAYQAGFDQVRLIHGRGIGVQRQRVRKILQRSPLVEAFGDAPMGAGGWGATLVRLKLE